LNQRNTRWIICGTAAALWVTTALTAHAGLGLRMYLAVWLATLIASCAALACLVDAMAQAREERKRAMARAELGEAVQVLCGAIGDHAGRMETVTAGHGERLRRDVFAAERWVTNRWRGEALAQYDAAAEAARHGSDTGPLPPISAFPH
jgi:hypothetical protein